MNKKLVRLIGAFVVFCACIYAAQLQLQNRFIIENRTGHTVAHLNISTGDPSYSFDDIPAGASTWTAYECRGMEGFSFVGRLQDGTPIKENSGYTKGVGIVCV